MHNYCITCLSSNRYLSKPSLDIRILSEKLIPVLNSTDGALCWECINLLKKVNHFCQQVIQTTNILHTHLKNKSNDILVSKSKLDVSNVRILNINPNVDNNIQYLNKEVNIYNNSKKRYLENKCSYFSIENTNNNEVIKEAKKYEKIDIRTESSIINKTEKHIKTNKNNVEQKQQNIEHNNVKTVDDVFREMTIEALTKNNNNTISNINNLSSINEKKYSQYTYKANKTKKVNKRNFKTVDEIIKEMENEKNNKNKLVEKETKLINYSKNIASFGNDIKVYHIDLSEENEEKSNSIDLNNYVVNNKKTEKIGLKTKTKKMLRKCKAKCFHCKICGQIFKTRGAYEYHKESHLQKKPFCVQCGKLFASKSVLWTHNNLVHKGVKNYTCEQCKRIFFTINGYETHVATHQVEKKIFFCEPCGTFFQSNSTYRRHLRVSKKHYDPLTWKYKCSECDRSFQTESDLKHHRDVIHLNINKYKCETCPKKYCNEKALKMHIRTKHEKINIPKNKMCDICGDVFRSSQLLTLHTKNHHVLKKT